VSGLPPAPRTAVDTTGRTWQVHRLWPAERTPGDYILEVVTPGESGVRGAHLRSGHFELLPDYDPGLPALQAEARHGEIICHRPHKRAVIRADGCYIKIFEPGGAVVPAERCAQTDLVLEPGTFTVPKILRSSPDVLVFSTVPGRTLGDLSLDYSRGSDETFARVWEKWTRAWTAQVGGSYDAARRRALATLPLHPPEAEVADLRRWVNRWLRHYENVPEASAQGDALRARAEDVAQNLLGTEPDPLVWAHGDLHDRQILTVDGPSPLGLLDFDDTSQAEAARDLANMDVLLEIRARQNRLTPARYRTAHTQILAAAEELQVSPGRFHTYSDVAWLRKACSTLPRRSAMGLAILEERFADRGHRAQELMT
jgi:hypothetical protein